MPTVRKATADEFTGRVPREQPTQLTLLPLEDAPEVVEVIPGEVLADATGKYSRYPAYKASGVAWMGMVPAHWRVTRLKFIADVRSGVAKGRDLSGRETVDLPYLRVANVQDGYLDLSDVALIILDQNEVERYLLCDGDVLMNEGGDFDKLGRGAVWRGEIPRCVHQNHVFAVRPHDPDTSISYWINLITQAAYAKQYFISRSVQSTNLASISATGIRELPLVLPPPQEQRAIVAFLDAETARIDTLIVKQEELIALLEEKRRAVISHTVTKGLDASTPMRDSGVAWLGEVPAHWEVGRFKHCCSITEGQVDPTDEAFADTVLIAPNHIESGTGRILYTETVAEQGAISGKYPVRRGEIIYSKIRPALNKVCIAQDDWLCSADMYPIKVTGQLDPSYLFLFFLSDQFVNLMTEESMRVAMPKVNRETLVDCPLLVPPLQEQLAIASSIADETTQLDTLIAKAQQFIDLLREHRAALIAAAVTGQIDVRGVAAEVL